MKKLVMMGICLGMVFMMGCGNTDVEVSESTAEESTATTTVEEAQESETEEVETEVPESEVQEPEQGEETLTLGTYPDGTSPVLSDVRLRLTIGDEEVIVRMYDNTAVDAFLERLPLEDLNFYDLSGIEKPVERPEEAFSIAEETPGYDPVTGEMVIYRPWGNFTFFYGDFRHSDELVPLGIVESGLEILAGQTEDFTGSIEIF